MSVIRLLVKVKIKSPTVKMDVVEGIVWNQIGNRFDNSGSSDLFYEKKWEWKYLRVSENVFKWFPCAPLSVQSIQLIIKL